jgi:shikimate dehydrogenase
MVFSMSDNIKSDNTSPDNYAVFGNPIEHSKSPAIHSAFAAATGENIRYQKHLVDRDGFVLAADTFFAEGGKGLNITVPFKQEAYSYAARLTPRARCAGAVNTLCLQDDGTVLGDTTDGVGMVRDIVDNLGWQIKGKKVLVLGAGGAVRGVLGPLLDLLPQHVVIANRTIEKALQLSKGFAERGYLLGCGFDMLPGQQFDLVINGTSASLSGDLPPLPSDLLTEQANCYDMMYGAEPTVFLQWGQQHGARAVADGLGMLVEQAAEAFYLWRGVRPETKSVIADLRQAV